MYTEYQFKTTDFAITSNTAIYGVWVAPETGYITGFLRLCTYISGTHNVTAILQSNSDKIQCAQTIISAASASACKNEMVFAGYVTKGKSYSIVITDSTAGSGLATSRLVYRYL